MIRYAGVVCAAFLRRDLAIATSYRVPFALELIALGFATLEFWFIARIVRPGAVPGGYFPFTVLGMVVSVLLAAMLITAATTLRQEQVQGTFEGLLATGIPPWLMACGLSTYPLIAAVVRSILLLVAAVAVDPFLSFGSASNWSLAAAVLGVGSACFMLLGMIVSALVILFRQGAAAGSWLATILLFGAGFAFPLSLLPPEILRLSKFSPVTQVLLLTREALLEGLSWSAARPRFLMLLAMTVAWGGIGVACVSAAVRRARRTGVLSSY